MGNKYSPEQLRQMARTALAARDAGDRRWYTLRLLCATMSGLGIQETERRIEALAK